MDDERNIMHSLECCSNRRGDFTCYDCYYEDLLSQKGVKVCTAVLAQQALQLLRGKEAKLLLVDQIAKAHHLDVWLEEKDDEIIHPLLLVDAEADEIFVKGTAFFWPGVSRPVNEYLVTWRCWTARPTEKVRKRIEWLQAGLLNKRWEAQYG